VWLFGALWMPETETRSVLGLTLSQSSRCYTSLTCAELELHAKLFSLASERIQPRLDEWNRILV